MSEIRPYSFAKPEPTPDSISAVDWGGVDLSALKFLVVDSVPDMRAATCAQLTNFGAGQVSNAGRSIDALRLIRQHEFDVILSEYDLGNGFDGLYLFEEARRYSLLKASCVFIILTAERRATRVIGAAELAPDAIVLKPYTGETLYNKLSRALRRKARFRPIDEAILAHDFLLAIRLCESGIAANDEDAPAFLRMKVHLLMRVADWSTVRSVCRELLATSDWAWARMALGKAQFHLNGFEEANTVFQGVIAEHELVIEAYDWLARTQCAEGDIQSAQETLKRATARSPYVVARQRDLGAMAWRNGDLATAESAMAETVRLARFSFWRDPADFGRLAEVQLARGDTLSARRTAEAIRKEFKTPPAVALAAALDADIWFKQGDKQKAREALDQSLHELSLQLAPPSPEIGLQIAHACINQQRFESGEKIVRTVLKNQHEDMGLQARVLDIYRQAGREEQGVRMIEDTAQDIVTLNNEAVKLAQSGDLGAAAERFIQAVAEMPSNVQVLLNAVNALLACVNRDGRHDSYMRHIEEYLERVLAVDPNNGRALQLAEIHRRICLRYPKE